MTCIRTVSYSYLVNDSVQGSVLPSRGIRQGDPLSPYLFILCSEVLSGLCKRAQQAGLLSGIRVVRGSPRVNHLLFVDDTMFFIRTDELSCSTLHRILQQYKTASGQTINTTKSAITFSAKTTQETRTRVKSHLGIAKEGGVGKYLGLPEHFGQKKRDLFASIVDRIRQQASCWTNRFLSSAGKMTMLKAVLSASPTHAMSCFELPVSLCKRIQSTLTRFWWDGNDNKKKMCMTSWAKLSKPKKLGGLGFRDIQLFNKALLAKQSWRVLTNPDCLLSRVLRGKYCHNASFLTVKAQASCSHGWRGILHGRDLLAPNIGKAIGDGMCTRVWKDAWIRTDTLSCPMGPANEEVLDLFVSDLLLRGSGEWNKPKIRQLLPAYG